MEGKGFGSAPISVTDTAVNLRDSRKQEAVRSPILDEYDEVWCVIDVEAPTPHESLDRAVFKARDHGLNVAISNPCFEFWYLLHFRRTSALMQTSADVMNALKRHYPQYKKNDPASFRMFDPLTDRAIANADAVLREKHYGEDLRKCNPSTHVHRLVRRLQEIADG